MFNFNGSTALVTGASRGLGAAFARQLASRGANLVLVARSISPLRELANSLSHEHNVECIPLEADLAVPDAAQRIAHTLDQWGLHVDLLINNAGLGLPGSFLQHSLDSELGTVQVNVLSVVGLTHALGQRMILRGRGGIINLSSNAAFLPLPNLATYAASKAFVLHFTEAVRSEMRASGVRVMAVAPGPTATSFFDGVATRMHPSEFDDADEVARRTLSSFLIGDPIAYPGRWSVRLGTLLVRLASRESVVRAAASKTRKMGLAS